MLYNVDKVEFRNINKLDTITNMNKKIISIAIFGILAFSSMTNAQASDLPNAGLTPESPFYFFDKFGEALREFFTFNPEGKAHLQVTFAAERAAEIKVVFESKGIEAKGIEVAQGRLQAHLANAATILEEQKTGGKDVSQLAKELDDDFENSKSALEQTFKEQERVLEAQEKELKRKILEARRAGNTAQVESLVQQFGQVKAQKELFELKEEKAEEALEREEERIEEEMGAKAEAEKKIRKAEREKQDVLDEAAEEGVSLSPETFNAFDKHISEAKAALAAGKLAEAKHHAEEAKENLEKMEDVIDDLEEAREKEEELKEEQEEKEREAKEEAEELKKEKVEKEAERLEKEREKAEKEVRKAEEKLREVGEEGND